MTDRHESQLSNENVTMGITRGEHNWYAGMIGGTSNASKHFCVQTAGTTGALVPEYTQRVVIFDWLP